MSGIIGVSPNMKSGVSGKYPDGHVLQVIQTVKLEFFSVSNTTEDVTGLAATITPSSASNKIMITLSGNGGGDAHTRYGKLHLYRGGSEITGSIGNSRGTEVRCWIANGAGTGNDSSFTGNFSGHYLDSPATTSATTYKIRLRCTTGQSTVGGSYDTSDEKRTSTPTVLTLMEISA